MQEFTRFRWDIQEWVRAARDCCKQASFRTTRKFEDLLHQPWALNTSLKIQECAHISGQRASETVPFLLNDIAKANCNIRRIQRSESEPSAPRLQRWDDLASIVANETKSGTLRILLDDCHCRETCEKKSTFLWTATLLDKQQWWFKAFKDQAITKMINQHHMRGLAPFDCKSLGKVS
jgi:hypothetical protein